MFALSARKVAIVAAIGLGSALSIGTLAAQAASNSGSDDQIRPTTVSSTDDGTVDLRGDGTPEDNGVEPIPAPGTPSGLPTDADHPQGDDSIGRADDSGDDSGDDSADDSADDSGLGGSASDDDSESGDDSDDDGDSDSGSGSDSDDNSDSDNGGQGDDD